MMMGEENRPPVCDYEGSDYQASFWDRGGREYEDRCEAIALRRLLPPQGRLLLELGAGAGRHTPRYTGFERVVLLDYSRTQLEEAQKRLGGGSRYLFVAANVYQLPFADELFDAATMIRVLHHMADAPAALRQARRVLRPGGTFILEFANKRHLKAILRYLLRRQSWSPFSLEPIEFAPLNFDFHPRAVRGWLKDAGFEVEAVLTVSHFRVGALKRLFPPAMLAGLDSLLQWSGALWQTSPSVFVRAEAVGGESPTTFPAENVSTANTIASYFKCLICGFTSLEGTKEGLACPHCGQIWPLREGIYDFRRA